MDYDDWPLVLPPEEMRDIVELIGPSGAPIRDVRIKGIDIQSNHPSGGFFGPELVGRNYRALLDAHPVYIDPMSSLAGAYMTNFFSYRDPNWNPDIDRTELDGIADTYHVLNGIGGVQHFCQDPSIGLSLGWDGLLEKIDRYAEINGPETQPFYTGLRQVIFGVQGWIERHITEARKNAAEENDPDIRENFESILRVNQNILHDPPESFLEACQWILWFQLTARMYNGSGSLGTLDQLLLPYYRNDTERGMLEEEEAVFHIACFLLRETAYIQLGGYDENGNDTTNELSYLILDAIELMKIPANIGVCVGERIDPRLLRRGVEMQFRHKNGIPKFLGIDNTAAGFARNGYPISLGYNRIYSGCHWCAIPGREYTMNDLIKVNLARIFEVVFDEYTHNNAECSVEGLWDAYEHQLRSIIDTVAEGVDLHMAHMHEMFPELPLDLLCYGTVEKGRDITAGAVEYYDIGIDAAGLSVTADSFAAIDQRIENEGLLTWRELNEYIKTDWAGPDGGNARLKMKSVPRYGYGGSIGDEYAKRISRLFTKIVKEKPTPAGYTLVPGLFSWALAAAMGSKMGATPDGRHAGDPLAHGCNPSPGFRTDNAATALATAVAEVQPGYGQSAPLQLDIDPGITPEEDGIELVSALISTHFKLGGTQINLNVMDSKKILEAYEDPAKYPDLVVRVTGFSAYFASLSEDVRKLVVDRIVG